MKALGQFCVELLKPAVHGHTFCNVLHENPWHIEPGEEIEVVQRSGKYGYSSEDSGSRRDCPLFEVESIVFQQLPAVGTYKRMCMAWNLNTRMLLRMESAFGAMGRSSEGVFDHLS